MGVQFGGGIRSGISLRRPERLALLFGLATGPLAVILAAAHLTTSPELDYHAYYFTGRAVLAGEPFVGWAITEGSFLTDKAYVYTPVTAPVFVVFGLFPRWEMGYVLNIALLFVVFLAVGHLVLRLIERHGMTIEPFDRLLILAFCVFSGHSVLGMYRGNVDPIILLLLGVGFFAMEEGKAPEGGALWAIAAHFKLFPAFLGIWMLYRGAYRAIAAAVVTGIGLILVGIAVFGIEAHVEFVEFIVNERSREGAFLGGLDPTIQWITLRRPLSHLFYLTGNQLFVVSTALVAPFVYLVYRDAETDIDALVAFFATMVAMLITIVPSTVNYVVYLYFPLLALVYLTREPVAKYLFASGLVLVNLPIYPHHVEMLVGALPIHPGLGEAVLDIAWAFLTYSSIPLVGFLLLLAGCLRFVRVPDPLTPRPDR